MLESLQIKNYLFIDNLNLAFDRDFTVITGETGAGKSIIISALMLALGEKLSGKKLPKDENHPVSISAIFDLSNKPNCKELSELAAEADIHIENDQLIFRRTISIDGRSKFYINDSAVSNALVQQFRELIVEICGQHSSRSLLDKANHLRLLDSFGRYQHDLESIKTKFATLVAARNKLDELNNLSQTAGVERDFIQTLVKDLTRLDPKAGEEDALQERRRQMQDHHKVVEIAGKLSKKLGQMNLSTELYALQREAEKGGEGFSAVVTPLNNMLSELTELEAQVDDLVNKFPSDSEMEEIESRLFSLRGAARKYFTTTDELPNLLAKKQAELDEIENLSHHLQKAEKALKEATEEFHQEAALLSKKRQAKALELQKIIESHLADLKMEKVEILIEVTPIEDTKKWHAQGIDRIQFLVKTNVGQNFGEIAKTASGGELSRIMLSMKLALSNAGSANMLIFDEIDTGISGSVSSAVGKKLRHLAKDFQIISITHQPQVAASAGEHIHVAKSANTDDTTICVTRLTESEKIMEIARMLSGEKLTEESISAAKALMSEAQSA